MHNFFVLQILLCRAWKTNSLDDTAFPLRKMFTKFSIAQKYLYRSLFVLFWEQFRTTGKFSLKLQLLGMEILYWNNFRISLPAHINSLNKAENWELDLKMRLGQMPQINAHHFPRQWQTLHEIFRCEWQRPEPPRGTVKWHLLHSEWNNLQWNNLIKIKIFPFFMSSKFDCEPSELYYAYEINNTSCKLNTRAKTRNGWDCFIKPKFYSLNRFPFQLEY